MKAFVSSLITGMEAFRDAAREAVETARFVPVMAEDFGALPTTPQVACLAELRDSDVMVLMLGERYGAVQPSGLSATHEEWREAQDRNRSSSLFKRGSPVNRGRRSSFAKSKRGPAAAFEPVQTPRELRVAVGRALGDYERANAVAPVNEADFIARAAPLIPVASGHSYSGPV